jgi:hypothetical protein
LIRLVNFFIQPLQLIQRCFKRILIVHFKNISIGLTFTFAGELSFMKKTVLLLLLCGAVSIGAYAQRAGSNYKTALGVKVWDGAGISFKTFVIPRNALELIGYFNKNGTRITGLYEIHRNIKGAGGLKWYAGPGAHIALYSYKGYYGDKAIAGVDGVLGLDYKINKAPLNLSLDWQPSFEFADNRGFEGGWFGLGIRYTF